MRDSIRHRGPKVGSTRRAGDADGLGATRVASFAQARLEGPPRILVPIPDGFERTKPGQAALPLPAGAPRPKGTSILDVRLLQTARDEAVDATGSIRPQYRGVQRVARAMTQDRLRRSLRQTRAAFRGDNAMHPIPRVLVGSEYDTLKKGVTQRGAAIRMFLEDHYSGKKTYASIISPRTVDEIIARNGESFYAGLVDPRQISFPYGPDVMRAQDGKFYVIEDNTGFIGGLGDLLKARETLFATTPELAKSLKPIDDPNQYYVSMVARAKERANPVGGKVIMYQVPPYADNEDKRFKALMESHGVDVITPHTRKRLQITPEGVFMVSKDKQGQASRERVGFIFLNGEHRWVDASHPSTRPAYFLREATDALEDKKLGKRARAALEAAMVIPPKAKTPDMAKVEKALRDHDIIDAATLADASTAKGLMDAIYAGRVATNYSPGIDFVGDKAFKGYVDDLVRFYLKEEPALQSIPVTRFTKRERGGREVLDRKKVAELFDDDAYKKYVFKVVDGRGGTGVYIGPKMKPEQVPAVRKLIEKEPHRYIAEPFTQLSTLAGHIVDLRLLSTVDPKGVIVTPTPWGRGVPVDGDGKVNISQNGKEFAVVVVKDPVLRKRDLKAHRSERRPRGVELRTPHRSERVHHPK